MLRRGYWSAFHTAPWREAFGTIRSATSPVPPGRPPAISAWMFCSSVSPTTDRLSQRREPLNLKRMCERLWTLPVRPHRRASLRAAMYMPRMTLSRDDTHSCRAGANWGERIRSKIARTCFGNLIGIVGCLKRSQFLVFWTLRIPAAAQKIRADKALSNRRGGSARRGLWATKSPPVFFDGSSFGMHSISFHRVPFDYLLAANEHDRTRDACHFPLEVLAIDPHWGLRQWVGEMDAPEVCVQGPKCRSSAVADRKAEIAAALTTNPDPDTREYPPSPRLLPTAEATRVTKFDSTGSASGQLPLIQTRFEATSLSTLCSKRGHFVIIVDRNYSQAVPF